MINNDRSKPCKPLVECANDGRWERMCQRGNGDPLLLFLIESAAFNPAIEEFLREERIPFALCVQQRIHVCTERTAISTDSKCTYLCSREWSDANGCEYTSTGEFDEGTG